MITKIPKDILLYIGCKLDLSDLLNFCKVDGRLDKIWLQKIAKEFPEEIEKCRENLRKYYIGLHLKEKLMYKGTVEELYKLHLSKRNTKRNIYCLFLLIFFLICCNVATYFEFL